MSKQEGTPDSKGASSISFWQFMIFPVIAFLVAIVAPYLLAVAFTSSEVLGMWFSGAARIGLLSGYTTGASEQTGIGSEFLKFISGGVLIPLLGVTGLFQGSEKVTETYDYADSQLVKKVTDTSDQLETTAFHPLVGLGGFLLFYSLFAGLGIVLGVYHRNNGICIKMRAVTQRHTQSILHL